MGTNLIVPYCIVYLYSNVFQVLILLDSLRKLKACNQLQNAYFIVDRLPDRESCSEALIIASDNGFLLILIGWIIEARFLYVQEEDVAEMITYFESPVFGPQETLESESLYRVCAEQVSSLVLKCIIDF